MMPSINELNLQINHHEETVQKLKNTKIIIKLFSYFDIDNKDLENLTDFKLQSSYTSWKSEFNEYSFGYKGSLELTFIRNGKNIGFSLTFIRESPSYDAVELAYKHGSREIMKTHYINEANDTLIKKIIGDPNELLKNWQDILN